MGETGRRPSLIVQDERRRPSSDARRPSVKADDDQRMEAASTPLRPIGDQGPPVIVDVQLKYTAVEDDNGFIDCIVEGNPVPSVKFFKGITEINEGGRYK